MADFEGRLIDVTRLCADGKCSRRVVLDIVAVQAGLAAQCGGKMAWAIHIKWRCAMFAISRVSIASPVDCDKRLENPGEKAAVITAGQMGVSLKGVIRTFGARIESPEKTGCASFRYAKYRPIKLLQ